MDYVAFNISFYGIFFIVTTALQFNVAKSSGKVPMYSLILLVRIFAYLFLILSDSMFFFLVFLDVILTIVFVIKYGNNIVKINDPIPVLKCPKCGVVVNESDKFCAECGYLLKTSIVPATVDPMYLKSESALIQTLIENAASKNNCDINVTLPEMKKRKIIISIICALISFILTSLIFFHISNFIVILELINLVVYILIMNRFDTMKYLIKEVKSRPDEDLEYVVSNVLSNVTTNKYSKYIYIASMVIGIILPLIIFSKPHLFYEDTENGYYVRFYTTSIIGEKNITIPEEHKGKKVIGIRGNVFMNLKRLKSVTLPDSIEVIRGHAFDGDSSLESINLPSNLNYLGGGAFKDCRRLKSINIPDKLMEIHGNTFENTGIENIEIPDTIADIGGESFKDCEHLKSVKLPNNITEIHGNTFENCVELESIEIPSSVTRIGGHAFYNNKKLSNVTFKEDSNLVEIGSSAFRLCSSLRSIVLPKSATLINERAFKESPTAIYYFGDPMYGKTIDKSKYKYDSFGYLRVGETHIIGEYYGGSISHNEKLILTNISNYGGKVIYYLQYIGNNETKTFTLDKDNYYLYINDNLAIEIDSKYSATNIKSISFDIYYN